jgi:hypothetical protein
MSREKEKNENETAAILGFWVGEYGGRPLILEGTANGNSLIFIFLLFSLLVPHSPELPTERSCMNERIYVQNAINGCQA